MLVDACRMAREWRTSEILGPHVNSTSSNGAYDPYHTNTNNPQGDIPPVFYLFHTLRVAMHVVFFVYIMFAVVNTRRYIRSKYAISENNCHGMEDCCYVFWCQCCTITQMARHTGVYDTNSARCCTETGLPPNAPAIV